ncbi:TonB-dependent siderophore receptor [Pseudoroseicyclus aestuarii]|uniref:Iron complex outermembrane receptor protein n=1 Tax=Pseudoroseicyclus aestuarii TaxID=1795041 RepID=A0A318SNZ3_9RHOB|nr:TonB-dependent siderophore receptor [Pseudoroseicyclus aestuarii]PYE82325.1 iron complex outermembrane receptor protein [Pseudoroseicyclus aestuarii]
MPLRSRRSRRIAALLGHSALTTSLAAGLALQAAAQDTGEVVTLDPIVFTVLGADPVDGDANPFTLTGVKTATSITEVPQSVSVVGADEIERRNAAKIDEALDFTAGTQGGFYGYDSDTNWVYLRGFDATQTGVFQDGLQLYGNAFGAFYIDPVLVERIEVLRGPASMLYGASNPGGVLNYVSKRAGDADSATLGFGADTHGRVWATADATRVLDADTALRVTGKLQRVDGHGMFEDGLEGVVAGAFTRRFDSGADLTVIASYTAMDEDHVGGYWLPYDGTVSEAPFGRIDRDFNTGEPGEDSYRRDQLLLTGIWRQQIGGWQVTDTVRLGWAEIEEDQILGLGYADVETGTLSRLGFDHDSAVRSFGNDLTAERTVVSGGAEHQVLVGVNALHYALDETQYNSGATPISVTDPVYGAPQPGRGAPTTDDEKRLTQLGVYAQDQLRWGNGWIATVNARYDHVATEIDNALGADTDRSDEAFSGRIALAREIGAFTPYAVAGTFFNPPLTDNAPEEGRQYELGVKWSLDTRTLVTLAAFDIERTDVDRSRVGPDGPTKAVADIRSRGVELEATAELTPGLTLQGQVTKMDLELLSGANEGNVPFGRAETLAGLSLSWTPEQMPGLTLTGGLRHTGRSFYDDTNSAEVPEITLYDAGVSYDFAGGWSADLSVTNLTDESFVASCDGFWCYYGEERAASLSLRRSF